MIMDQNLGGFIFRKYLQGFITIDKFGDCYSIHFYIIKIMKQNQNLYRPFPGQNPETKEQDELYLQSKCVCSPCQSSPEKRKPEIVIDQDLKELKTKKWGQKRQSVFIQFMDQLKKHSQQSTLNFQILDTIVFNYDGSIKYVLYYENNRLKITKSVGSLKNYLFERKYRCDLDYQKKKHQREHMNFSFTQLDHESEKLIKQFEEKIKFVNPLLNRMLIVKPRVKTPNQKPREEQILNQTQINLMFNKISRKIFDFTGTEYLQVFPIMYGQEQHSYIRQVKYFRERECKTLLYKTAEQYVSNWVSKNQTLEKLQENFVNKMKTQQQQDNLLMYYTCKLFIHFQHVSDKMIDSALLQYITTDDGISFSLKTIETCEYHKLHQIDDQKKSQKSKSNLPLEEQDLHVDLKQGMKGTFEEFQKNYYRLKQQNNEMEEKLRKDIEFSNRVYESLGYGKVEDPSESFITHLFSKDEQQVGKIQLGIKTPPKQML